MLCSRLSLHNWSRVAAASLWYPQRPSCSGTDTTGLSAFVDITFSCVLGTERQQQTPGLIDQIIVTKSFSTQTPNKLRVDFSVYENTTVRECILHASLLTASLLFYLTTSDPSHRCNSLARRDAAWLGASQVVVVHVRRLRRQRGHERHGQRLGAVRARRPRLVRHLRECGRLLGLHAEIRYRAVGFRSPDHVP